MRILHTSDWHLGRTLYGRKRYGEFEAFLNWLAETIQAERIDALLVAGDIFDTSTPSNRSQEIYYRFLCRAAASSCRHIVVIAGNHDSPSFLNAPRELLKALDVHVIGSISEALEDEMLVLRDEQEIPELIVCAVPYLRDRDIRTAEAGESMEDKERKLMEGIRGHYAAVAALAEQKRTELGADIPIVGMGHLFTAGGRTVVDDGVRELYVGSLAHVAAETFPECFDYLALGHLHVPQKVHGSETIRYSGSPLPMGFGEAAQEKSIVILDFGFEKPDRDPGPRTEVLPIPCFQQLVRIVGSLDEIHEKMEQLKREESRAWLEIVYGGEDVVGDLRGHLDTAVADTEMEVLRVKNNRIIKKILEQFREEETLDDLDVNDVFERCLAVHEVPEDQRRELLHVYQETLSSLYEDDDQAE